MVRRLLALTAVLGLAGCSSSPATPGPAASDVPTFTNPVFADNFPDPGVIPADGTWYAYGTNNASANVPVMTSPDLVSWAPRGTKCRGRACPSRVSSLSVTHAYPLVPDPRRSAQT